MPDLFTLFRNWWKPILLVLVLSLVTTSSSLTEPMDFFSPDGLRVQAGKKKINRIVAHRKVQLNLWDFFMIFEFKRMIMAQ